MLVQQQVTQDAMASGSEHVVGTSQGPSVLDQVVRLLSPWSVVADPAEPPHIDLEAAVGSVVDAAAA